MDLSGAGQIVVALTGLAGLILGLKATKKGERKAALLKEAADEAAEHEREFKRNQQALENAYRMLEEQRTETLSRAAALTSERAMHEEDRRRHEAELVRARAEADAEVNRVREWCTAERNRLVDAMTGLMAIVHDEVAKAAAVAAIEESARHQRDDHGEA